ncbi:hypothetical protein CTAYLR_001083 [Chrysophaeum taylorii]|uniref:30S ribosomal protein S9 n=1 Tax=Chrysophaeum taylorii TaxID=2483200 RepID=A0AAD7UH17_9STRA|nr:hypothetical protein CTAYLR_001083 [Chrysophaeum taylorii]
MLRRLRVLGLARPSSALSSSMVPSVVRTEEVDEKRDDDANAPIVRVRTVDELGRAYGTGRRKTASARVWVFEGTGKITVNTKSLVDYFPRNAHCDDIVAPFFVTDTAAQFDVWCTVKGGGVSGQAGAVRLGIARALQNFNPDLRPPLKKAGFLTRDRRRVERKKPGLVKARKAPQWVKR